MFEVVRGAERPSPGLFLAWDVETAPQLAPEIMRQDLVNCPNCGTVAEPGVRFCANCGAGLPGNAPVYASPVATRNWRQLTIYFGLALFAGLAVGSFIFFRMRPPQQDTYVPIAETKEKTAAANVTVAPKSEDQAAVDRATDVAPRSEGEKRSAVTRAGASPSAVSMPKQRNEPAFDLKTPAVTTPRDDGPGGATPSATATSKTEQASVAVNSAAAANQASTKTRRAVQEPDGTPTDSAVSPNISAPNTRQLSSNPSPQEGLGTGAVPPPPLSEKPGKPAYVGPNAGLATWSGNLGKGDTLTITSGTPSSGVLTGAGLPGVPVRIIIDQTNLGFVESPSAANDFNKLVLKSHGHHDRITIHWTVIQ